MKRRELLIGAGALLTTLFANKAFAASTKHSHTSGKKFENIIDSGLNCVKKGEACIQHCLAHFSDASLAECAARVQEMLPICQTLSKLATYESRHLKAYLTVCIQVCKDCEKACRVHENEHVPCKECADACARCIAECEKALTNI
jgi:Cys-rich four helix bundle protein (predicted Tat secretion target)